MTGFVEGLRRGQHLRRSRARRLAFCTIATEDFMPWALALFDSLARHHPDAARVVLYVRGEKESHRVPAIEGVSVVAVGDLVDAGLEATLRRRYTMPELCFALKPRLLGHCLDKFGERAIYLDSDIDVRGPLDQAMIELERASVVLTPHLDVSLPHDGKLPSEVTILRAGVCNAGFVAVAESPDARAFLAWWDGRVSRWGFVAPDSGYQGDQKWLDLAPTLFRNVTMLRDRGSNVGGWNLHSRRVERGGAGYMVNGSALAFFHFSGFDPDNPAQLSKYQNRIRLADQPAVAELARDFAQRVVAARPRASALKWTERALPASTARPVTHREGPMAPEAYVQQLWAASPEFTFETREEIVVNVRVTNPTHHHWAVGKAGDGSGGIGLSYHLLDALGEQLCWDNPRYQLPADLGPGESLEMDLGIRAPWAPGRYVLELDLVHEGVTWFSGRHGHTHRFVVLVGRFEEPA